MLLQSAKDKDKRRSFLQHDERSIRYPGASKILEQHSLENLTIFFSDEFRHQLKLHLFSSNYQV